MTGAEPPGDAYRHIEPMFAALAAATDDEERRQRRGEIIRSCLPLADNIAYRFVGRGEPGEDLVQVARLGLVKTVDRYELGKGSFLGFAISTIVGEVRRHFRDNTWGMHVPRKIKDNHRRIRVAIDPLSQRLGRAPTAGELADELQIDREDVARSIDAAYAYRPMSLEATLPRQDGDQTLGARQGVEDPHYETIEEMLALASMLAGLSERERTIVSMRFCECLTQTEIARRLGISQVHVSRLLGGILERLRAEMEPSATDARAIAGLSRMADRLSRAPHCAPAADRDAADACASRASGPQPYAAAPTGAP